MFSAIDDLRAAWRGLLKAPGFFASASGVLALGLGATIFMFGVIVTTMQRPPPFEQAEHLYQVMASLRGKSSLGPRLDYLDYLEVKAEQRTFDNVAAYYADTISLSGQGTPEQYDAAFVTYDYLWLLRVRPMLGRDFEATDDAPNAPPVAIISYEMWHTRFNGDSRVVGHTVRINGRTTTIVGVAPRGFKFPQRELIWIPMAVDAAPLQRVIHSLSIEVIGRLRDGASVRQANDDLAALASRLSQRYPRTNAGMTLELLPIASAAVGVEGARLLYTVFGAVWLVLLIACTNVAGLILVRANFRAYEASMRAALGARRLRLVAQMLAESVIVSVVGLISGLLLAALGLFAIQTALPSMIGTEPPSWWHFSIDGRVAAFSALAALVTGLLAGVGPAFRASRPDIMRILRDGGRTGTGMRAGRFTTAMVIVELCLSCILLTTATFMSRSSFLSLQGGVGADVSGFTSGTVALPTTYSAEQRARFYERLVASLAQRPGIQAVAAATAMPGTGADPEAYGIEGREYRDLRDLPKGQIIDVVPGFFQAFHRPILSGRDFDSRDRGTTQLVAVVNEAFARANFPAQNPIGKRIRVSPRDPKAPWLAIVGMVPDIQHDIHWAPGRTFPAVIYLPVSQRSPQSLAVALKGIGAFAEHAKLLRDAVSAMDPDLPVFWLRTIEAQQAVARGGFRLLASVLVVFAVVAVVLAGVGIYGVLAFAMGQRVREIGVRRALGARNRQILATVARSAGLQLAVGLGLGLALSLLIPRALGDVLDSAPADGPVIYSLIFAVLGVTAALASWVPARRALRIEPAAALRCD